MKPAIAALRAPGTRDRETGRERNATAHMPDSTAGAGFVPAASSRFAGSYCLPSPFMLERPAMIRSLFAATAAPLQRVQAASARWIASALALTLLAWLAALGGLLAVANRVHDDVPALLAVKLPLLRSHPELIFAG